MMWIVEGAEPIIMRNKEEEMQMLILALQKKKSSLKLTMEQDKWFLKPKRRKLVNQTLLRIKV